MKLQSCIFSVVVSVSIGLLTSINANAAYTFTDLGLLDGKSSAATGINNLNQVIGFFTKAEPWGNQNYGVVWSDGVARDLHISHPYSINNAGQIVGGYTLANADPSINNTSIKYGVNILSINNVGQMVGVHKDYSGYWTRPIFMSGVNAPPVELPSAGITSSAFDINDNGIIVGETYPGDYRTATLWNGTTMTFLPPISSLPNNNSGSAAAINNANQVVGKSVAGTALHATLWNGTTPTDLGTLTNTWSGANDINNVGQIVGWLSDDNRPRFAALWSATNSVNLNTLLDADAISKGWILTEATAINDNGWIVGNALDVNGVQHAFLLSSENLTPVPLPAAAWLFGSALFGLVSTVRKRKNTD